MLVTNIQVYFSIRSPLTPLRKGYGVHTSGCKVEREVPEEIKQVENPILIHAQEHKGKTFGDPRLVKR
ncbi:MAG: hypothetical protein ACKO3K_00710, partial [Cuspidothrix sp.]